MVPYDLKVYTLHRDKEIVCIKIVNTKGTLFMKPLVA